MEKRISEQEKIKMITLVFIVMLAVIISISASWANASPFSDIGKEHWAYDSIIEMHKEGIIAGYPDGTFKPNRQVSYGEFIKMATTATGIAGASRAVDIAGAAGAAGTTGAAGATGTPEKPTTGHWAMPYYNAALNNMFFTDWDITTRQLDHSIPRKDMAMVASGAMGEEVKISDYGDYAKLRNDIEDLEQAHSQEFHIIKAYATGVLTGYPDKTFRPEGVLTRAEAASVIWRLKQLIESEPIESEDEVELEIAPSMPKDRDTHNLVAVRKDPAGHPKGSIQYLMFDYHEKTAQRHKELRKILIENHPDYGEALYADFVTFAAKPVSPGGFGLRKRYFGDVPLYMDHNDRSASIHILPVGYQDSYWGLKPGQIEEYFD